MIAPIPVTRPHDWSAAPSRSQQRTGTCPPQRDSIRLSGPWRIKWMGDTGGNPQDAHASSAIYGELKRSLESDCSKSMHWENDMWRLLGIVFLFAVATHALSQPVPTSELPQYLEGKWINNAGVKIYSGRIAFQVESRAPDGSMTGRWTFEGVRCKGSELPAVAKYDGVQLVITARIDEGAICGQQTATFKRTDRSGPHSLFEGRLAGDGKVVIGSDVDVYLDPK